MSKLENKKNNCPIQKSKRLDLENSSATDLTPEQISDYGNEQRDYLRKTDSVPLLNSVELEFIFSLFVDGND